MFLYIESLRDAQRVYKAVKRQLGHPLTSGWVYCSWATGGRFSTDQPAVVEAIHNIAKRFDIVILQGNDIPPDKPTTFYPDPRLF